jgi:hypothetical protein
MENPGERLVGDYLRYIKKCDFVDFNVYTTATQGEIDVVGVARATKCAYICEVCTHLSTGIQYVKNARPDTANRLIKKFLKDIDYGNQAFADHYAVRYMLWSPVVRRSKGKPEYDQFAHLKKIEDEVRARRGVDIETVINERFLEAIDTLREFARQHTKELKSPIMRFLQIEEWAKKNLMRRSQAQAEVLDDGEGSRSSTSRATESG